MEYHTKYQSAVEILKEQASSIASIERIHYFQLFLPHLIHSVIRTVNRSLLDLTVFSSVVPTALVTSTMWWLLSTIGFIYFEVNRFSQKSPLTGIKFWGYIACKREISTRLSFQTFQCCWHSPFSKNVFIRYSCIMCTMCCDSLLIALLIEIQFDFFRSFCKPQQLLMFLIGVRAFYFWLLCSTDVLFTIRDVLLTNYLYALNVNC